MDFTRRKSCTIWDVGTWKQSTRWLVTRSSCSVTSHAKLMPWCSVCALNSSTTTKVPSTNISIVSTSSHSLTFGLQISVHGICGLFLKPIVKTCWDYLTPFSKPTGLIGRPTLKLDEGNWKLLLLPPLPKSNEKDLGSEGVSFASPWIRIYSNRFLNLIRNIFFYCTHGLYKFRNNQKLSFLFHFTNKQRIKIYNSGSTVLGKVTWQNTLMVKMMSKATLRKKQPKLVIMSKSMIRWLAEYASSLWWICCRKMMMHMMMLTRKLSMVTALKIYSDTNRKKVFCLTESNDMPNHTA